MIKFHTLVQVMYAVRGYLAKGAGHKYIKRIPVGQTATGQIKYRYIYKETHTVGGKNLLDEAHLKAGTKLMIESGDGKEVHAHIIAVNGDKVTVEFDDGARKGQTATMTKQQLLRQFDDAHDMSQKIDDARKQAQSDLESARRSAASEKMLKRLEARVERLQHEVSKNVPSALHKRILKDHTVTVEGVEKHQQRLKNKSTDQITSLPAKMMISRLDVLKSEGIEAAVTSYNNLIERAAADNQAVLTAIEAYQDMIAVRFDDPATLNQIMQTQADNLKQITALYGVSPDMTGDEALQSIDQSKRYAFKRDIQNLAGHDVQNSTSTLKSILGGRTSTAIITAQIEQTRLNSEVARRARAAIQEHIQKACAEFSFDHMEYNKGDFHADHKRDSRKRTSRQRAMLDNSSHVLAHAEDIFQRAYPERKGHKTLVTTTSHDRAAAEMIDDGHSEISLADFSSKTAAHELAHTLEGTRLGRAAYQQRIQDTVTLTHLTRTTEQGEQYHGNEYALKDKYHDKYAGKLYSDGSSELVTMGVQEFFNHKTRGYDDKANKAVDLDPSQSQMECITDFAITDPHHYLVTYGILKGYAK